MKRSGFTLIELLVVVVIIGILASIAMPKLGRMRERAAVAAMQADLNQLRTAMEMYHGDNQTYAGASAAALIFLSPGVVVASDVAGDAAGWTVTFEHQTAPGSSCSYDSDVGIIACVEP